jgi:hypothetical protein
MSKGTCAQLTGHISALCAEEQAVDIMPYPKSGGKPVRLYANDTLWWELVRITHNHWIKRLHTQGTFYRQGRVLLNFTIWSRE